MHQRLKLPCCNWHSPFCPIRSIWGYLSRYERNDQQFIVNSQEVIYKKAVLKNFAIFTAKDLCWSLFLIKLHTFRLSTLLKRVSKTWCFPVNIANFWNFLLSKLMKVELHDAGAHSNPCYISKTFHLKCLTGFWMRLCDALF